MNMQVVLAVALAMLAAAAGLPSDRPAKIVDHVLDSVPDPDGVDYDGGFGQACFAPSTGEVWSSSQSQSSTRSFFVSIHDEELRFQHSLNLTGHIAESHRGLTCTFVDTLNEMWIVLERHGLARYNVETYDLVDASFFDGPYGHWPWNIANVTGGTQVHYLEYLIHYKPRNVIAAASDVSTSTLNIGPVLEFLSIPVPSSGVTIDGLRGQMSFSNDSRITAHTEFSSTGLLHGRYVVGTFLGPTGVRLAVYDLDSETILDVYHRDIFAPGFRSSDSQILNVKVDDESLTAYVMDRARVLHRFPIQMHADGTFDRILNATAAVDVGAYLNRTLPNSNRISAMHVVKDQVLVMENGQSLIYQIDGRDMNVHLLGSLETMPPYDNLTNWGRFMNPGYDEEHRVLYVPNLSNSLLLKIQMWPPPPALPPIPLPLWLLLLLIGLGVLVVAGAGAAIVVRRRRSAGAAPLSLSSDAKPDAGGDRAHVESAAARSAAATTSKRSVSAASSKQRSGSSPPKSNRRGTAGGKRGKSASAAKTQTEEQKDLARQSMMTTMSAMTVIGSGDDYGYSSVESKPAALTSSTTVKKNRSNSAPRLRKPKK